ncbi:MAG: DUF5658 family protein [Candidatus Caldarchaeum sp.]
MGAVKEGRHDGYLYQRVPVPIISYAFLGLIDYALTLAAFHLGASEANPGLAWFHKEGLFEFAKISLTLLICCVAFKLWDRPSVRFILYLANGLMVGVVAYHAWIWASLVVW